MVVGRTAPSLPLTHESYSSLRCCACPLVDVAALGPLHPSVRPAPPAHPGPHIQPLFQCQHIKSRAPESEPVFVDLLRRPGIDSQPGEIDSSESIPGLHKRLQIWALNCDSGPGLKTEAPTPNLVALLKSR